MRSIRTIGFVVLSAVVVALLTSPLWAGKEARGKNYTKAEVQDLIRRIEGRTDDFQEAVDRDLDRSRIDGGPREDNINEQIKELETATDRMRERFDKSDDWDQNRNNAHDIVEEARDINDLFSRQPMYSAVKPQWMHLKREVNTLADVYGLRPLR